MDHAKYIIVDQSGIEVAIIFNPLITHADMAANFGGKSKVLGAGFCCVELHTEQMRAFGRSDSLGIDSTPEDTKVLNKLFQLDDRVAERRVGFDHEHQPKQIREVQNRRA